MKKIILLSLLASTFVACRKNINVDVKNATPQVVIEANLSNIANDTNSGYVLVSKTVNYSADNAPNYVTNAAVYLSDNAGNVDTLIQPFPGKYKIKNVGVPGTKYTLTVMVDGQTYVANNTMPATVYLDTIFSIPSFFGGKTNNVIVPVFLDKAGEKNYYRYVQYVNKVRQPQVHINDDQFNDGLYTQYGIFNGELDVKVGDTVTIDLQNIDASAYLYWYSLAQNQNTTPANPVSNFSNGALGYFSAYAQYTRSIVVQ
jgi:hypothetical protein